MSDQIFFQDHLGGERSFNASDVKLSLMKPSGSLLMEAERIQTPLRLEMHRTELGVIETEEDWVRFAFDGQPQIDLVGDEATRVYGDYKRITAG